MYKMIYGTDTGSIEDYYQAVALLVPDEWDAEKLEEVIRDDFYSIPQHVLVTWEDVQESLGLILDTTELSSDAKANILASLFDAIDNNDS